MRVLVTSASKHESTEEIAWEIAKVLRQCEHDVTLMPVDDVDSVEPFDAVVLGSAVYAGRWLKTAKAFVERYRSELAGKQVWLFSSGPIGDPPKPIEAPVDAEPMKAKSGAVDHRVFAGRIDRKRLNLAERAIVRAVHAPDGDFRDWDEIDGWASSIARTLGSR